MKNGKEFLLTDTVGFIQKLPTTLVRKIAVLRLMLLSMFDENYAIDSLSYFFIFYQINKLLWSLGPNFEIMTKQYYHFSAFCRLLPSELRWRRYQSHHFWCMWLISGYISVELLGWTLSSEKRNFARLVVDLQHISLIICNFAVTPWLSNR